MSAGSLEYEVKLKQHELRNCFLWRANCSDKCTVREKPAADGSSSGLCANKKSHGCGGYHAAAALTNSNKWVNKCLLAKIKRTWTQQCMNIIVYVLVFLDLGCIGGLCLDIILDFSTSIWDEHSPGAALCRAAQDTGIAMRLLQEALSTCALLNWRSKYSKKGTLSFVYYEMVFLCN